MVASGLNAGFGALAVGGPVGEGGSGPVLVIGIVLFALVGAGICLGGLVLGWFLRPRVRHPEKQSIYECGEPAIGRGWVQFDLRFYVVALVFIIFDVEIAFFWPWAVVFGQGGQQVKTAALYDMLFFFGVIVVGFLYLWRYGYLDWVRATSSTPREPEPRAEVSP